jgi:hypothetical protein
VESGYLTVHGPTFERDIDLTDQPHEPTPCHGKRDAEVTVARDIYSNAYVRLTEKAQRSFRAIFLLIHCSIDTYERYRERGIIIVPSKEHPNSYERVGYFDNCMKRRRVGWEKVWDDHLNLESWIERLRNGEVNPETSRQTLLPLCTLERVTII